MIRVMVMIKVAITARFRAEASGMVMVWVGLVDLFYYALSTG